MAYKYTGKRRDGVAVTGTLNSYNVDWFVEGCWRGRWQKLTVTAEDGHVVGTVSTLDGKRTWWSEQQEENK